MFFSYNEEFTQLLLLLTVVGLKIWDKLLIIRNLSCEKEKQNFLKLWCSQTISQLALITLVTWLLNFEALFEKRVNKFAVGLPRGPIWYCNISTHANNIFPASGPTEKTELTCKRCFIQQNSPSAIQISWSWLKSWKSSVKQWWNDIEI